MSASPATAPSSAVRRRTALAPELVVVWLSEGDDGEGEDGVLAELRGTPGIALEVLPGPDARPEKADVVHVSRSALGGLRE